MYRYRYQIPYLYSDRSISGKKRPSMQLFLPPHHPQGLPSDQVAPPFFQLIWCHLGRSLGESEFGLEIINHPMFRLKKEQQLGMGQN